MLRCLHWAANLVSPAKAGPSAARDAATCLLSLASPRTLAARGSVPAVPTLGALSPRASPLSPRAALPQQMRKVGHGRRHGNWGAGVPRLFPHSLPVSTPAEVQLFFQLLPRHIKKGQGRGSVGWESMSIDWNLEVTMRHSHQETQRLSLKDPADPLKAIFFKQPRALRAFWEQIQQDSTGRLSTMLSAVVAAQVVPTTAPPVHPPMRFGLPAAASPLPPSTAHPAAHRPATASQAPQPSLATVPSVKRGSILAAWGWRPTGQYCPCMRHFASQTAILLHSFQTLLLSASTHAGAGPCASPAGPAAGPAGPAAGPAGPSAGPAGPAAGLLVGPPISGPKKRPASAPQNSAAPKKSKPQAEGGAPALAFFICCAACMFHGAVGKPPAGTEKREHKCLYCFVFYNFDGPKVRSTPDKLVAQPRSLRAICSTAGFSRT